jgi:hypothetical protein
VRYNATSLNGTNVGAARPTVKYTFQTLTNNVVVDTSPDSLDFKHGSSGPGGLT